MRKLTQEQVIERIRAVWGDKYSTEKMVYVNRRTKFTLICPEHGAWETDLGKVMANNRCYECGNEIRKKKLRHSPEKALKNIKKKHPNLVLLDFDPKTYEHSYTPLKVRCEKHNHEWSTNYNTLQQGSGCVHCGNESSAKTRTTSWEVVHSKLLAIYGSNLQFNSDDYTDTRGKIGVYCKKHDKHSIQTVNSLLMQNSVGCVECGKDKVREAKTVPVKEFIKRAKKVHGDYYDYSKVHQYKRQTEKVTIICPEHGEFPQTPYDHWFCEAGCPYCNMKRGERAITLYLKRNNIEFNAQHKFDDLIYKSHLKCDFYIPSINAVIEFNGQQHYAPVDLFGGEKEFKKTVKRDEIKKKYCLDNGIRFEVIKYDEDIEERLESIFN